jgi:hypothetical protein
MPESNLDDYGAVLALLRPPCRRTQKGERVMEGHSRRDVLRIAASVAVASPLAGQNAAPRGDTPLFFTPSEFRMVDELSEIIIPADDHSPGARAAKVAAYIDKTLAESLDDKPRQEFRDGLKVVESLCQEMHGKAFLEATPEQRVAVMTRMSQHEDDPKKPEEQFFHRIKGRTAHAYYSSKIGIHQEIEYKGNTMLDEFVGFDADLVPIQPAVKRE